MSDLKISATKCMKPDISGANLIVSPCTDCDKINKGGRHPNKGCLPLFCFLLFLLSAQLREKQFRNPNNFSLMALRRFYQKVFHQTVNAINL